MKPKGRQPQWRRKLRVWLLARPRMLIGALSGFIAKWIGRPLRILNEHAAIVALLIGAPWALYQFWFKEIWVPATQVGHAQVRVELRCDPPREGLVPVHLAISLRNPGPGDADVFAAWYIVEGARLRQTALRDPEYRGQVRVALGQELDVAHRYVAVVHRQPLCNGSLLNALGVFGPQEEAHAQLVAFAPSDSFDTVRAYVFVMTKGAGAPGLTHPWDVQGGGWVHRKGIVQWKLVQGQYEFAPADDALLRKSGFRQTVSRAEVVLPTRAPGGS